MRQYQIDLAVEAANLGFDEILYDYVRRPEGDLATMQFPGLVGPPDVSIARFVAASKQALGDTPLGLSVFGISASRPEPTAQDMALLAPLVDYIAPMVYPSLWTSGEYGVPDPEGQPGDIVSASLSDFARITAGSGAAMVPWLQDFNGYGAPQIRAQIVPLALSARPASSCGTPNRPTSSTGCRPAPNRADVAVRLAELADRRWLLERMADGASVYTVAKELQTGIRTIYDALRRHGLARPPPPPTPSSGSPSSTMTRSVHRRRSGSSTRRPLIDRTKRVLHGGAQ